jgi:polyphosphate kinase
MPAEHTSAIKKKQRVGRPPSKAKQEECDRAGTSDASSPLDAPRFYVNRELSLLAFQKRVLDEARDHNNPLLERVKFLSIVGSNLDEFFMVRVAGLKRQAESGVLECGPDGMTPKQQLGAIRESVSALFKVAHECLGRQIFPALKKVGLSIVDYSQLTSVQRTGVNKYFSETVFPTLTPLAFDPGRPFPHISNLSLNLAVLIRDPQGTEHFARVKVPDILPQLIPVTPLVKEAGTKKRKCLRRSTLSG